MNRNTFGTHKMARVIIPGKRKPRGGERRFCDYMKNHLGDGFLIFPQYEITDELFLQKTGHQKPIRPDFIVLDPQFGLWVLEIKAWNLNTIVNFTEENAFIRTETGIVPASNPYAQVRQYAEGLKEELEACKGELCARIGGRGSRIQFGSGVVFTNIERDEFKRRHALSGAEMDMTLFGDESMPATGPDLHKRLMRLRDVEIILGSRTPPKVRFSYEKKGPIQKQRVEISNENFPIPPRPLPQPWHQRTGCLVFSALLAAGVVGSLYLLSGHKDPSMENGNRVEEEAPRPQKPIYKVVIADQLHVMARPTAKAAIEGKLFKGMRVHVMGNAQGSWKEVEAEVFSQENPRLPRRIHGYVDGRGLAPEQAVQPR